MLGSVTAQRTEQREGCHCVADVASYIFASVDDVVAAAAVVVAVVVLQNGPTQFS